MFRSSRSSLPWTTVAMCVSLLAVHHHHHHHLSSQDVREFDIVIFGATGYLGSLFTAMLLENREPFLSIAANVPTTSNVRGVRFALAGRNEYKLRTLRKQYADQGVDVSGIGIIVADLNDSSTLDRLAARTRVVMTTVVIKSLFAGEKFVYEGSLLERCVAHGTHLLDLDGYLWMDDVVLRHKVDAAARESGAVYSPSCGEVAVVPEMVVYRAWEELGRTPLKAADVKHYYFDGKSPPAAEDEPSMWEPYDAPVMRLSAEQLGYGAAFTFAETSPTNGAHSNPLKNKKKDVRAVAAFVTAADVESVDGRKVTTEISGGEIDYEDTARIAMAMALSLIQEAVPAKSTGGVWSAAAGWGDVLLDRLQHIGLKVSLAPKGATAATIMRDARERYIGRYA